MSMLKGIGLLLIVAVSSVASAQQFGFNLPQDSTYTRIAFNTNNNIMTIQVGINGRIVLPFIVDTSIEHTILTEKSIADQFGINIQRKIQLGSSPEGPLFGYSANGALIELDGGVYSGDNHSLMVLDYDFLGLSETAQSLVYGIIGRDLFGRFVVEIDNDRQVMTLWEPSAFAPPSDYDAIPIKFEGSDAKISVSTTFQNWEELQEYYLLKTGTPHTILYDNKNNVINMPYQNVETTLGRGSSGELLGHVARTRTISLGKYDFEEPIASFTSRQDAEKNRGSIGMGLLNRFNMIVDFHGATLYLKPNRRFNENFEFDMSGIKIAPNGDKFFLSYVQAGSPAEKAGLQVGDQVLEINREAITPDNYTEITSVFSSKPDKKITLKILQRDKESEVTFRLTRFI